MPAYMLANVSFRNPEMAREYGSQVPVTIGKYGGRYLVRGGKTEVVEGELPLAYLVVVEFPSLDRAKEWYGSDDYRPLRAIREKHARTDLAFLEGLAPQPA
jgi:uncharacterized protein (DUF1330 family)